MQIFYTLLTLFIFSISACNEGLDSSRTDIVQSEKLSVSLRASIEESIATNAALIFEFSHAIDTESINEKSILLYKLVEGNRILDNVLNIDALNDRTFRVYKDFNFDALSDYEIELSTGITSVEGFGLGENITYPFTTLADTDTIAPFIIHISPEDFGYSRSVISIIFNEPIVTLKEKTYIKLFLQSQTKIEVECSKILYGYRSISCIPKEELHDSSSYTVELLENVSDLSGNFSDINLSQELSSFYNSTSLLEQPTKIISRLHGEYLTTFDINDSALFYPAVRMDNSVSVYGIESVAIIQNDDNSSSIGSKTDFVELQRGVIGDALISKIIKSDTYLYVGTQKLGLYVIDTQTWTVLAHYTLPSTVSDIEILPNGNIFVSTLEDGLYHLEMGASAEMSLKRNLPDLAPIFALSSLNNIIYMARGYEGISSYDFNTQAQPIFLNKTKVFAHDVVATTDYNGEEKLIIADAQAGVMKADLNMTNRESSPSMHYAYAIEPVNDVQGGSSYGVIDVKKGITIFDSYFYALGYMRTDNFTQSDSSVLRARHLEGYKLTFLLNDQKELLVVQDEYPGDSSAAPQRGE